MRAILVLVLSLSLAASAGVGDAARRSDGCFDKLSHETPVGDKITIYTSDNRVISGVRPLLVSQSIIYGRTNSENGGIQNINISFRDINRITYSKPSIAKYIFPAIGFTLGACAGAAAWAKYVPDTRSWAPDFSPIFIGAPIGGAIGAGIGHVLGMQFTVKVNLQCR